MQRLLGLASALAFATLSTVLGAQAPAPAVSSSVSAPAAVTCSADFSSSLTLTGYNNETPGTADVVFVMDESGSIDPNEWDQLDAFVDATIDALDLANTGNRAALVKYGSLNANPASFQVETQVPLTSDATPLKNAGRLFMGLTPTHVAIEEADQHLQTQGRPEAHKFIIVLTDGQCSCTDLELNSAARTAENEADATMIAVGVQGANLIELNIIATPIPGVQTALFVEQFDDLQALVQSLIEAIVTPGANDVTVVVDAMPRFPVTGASATAGSVAVNGSQQVVWTLPSLGAGSQTLTIDHQHDGTGNGSLQVFSATYSDTEMHDVVIDVPSTVVSGCNTPPVANAGNDQTVAVVGATASVTLDGSGSIDDDLIQPLAYAWSSDTGVVASGVSPAVTLPVGTHTFTLVVDDGEFTDTDTVVITVIDTTPPDIDSVTPSTGQLWPPNHQMVPISIAVVATDNVDASPVCEITGVTSSESDNGIGDGNTTGDAVITGPLTVELRSERSGRGNGRTYTIEVTCTDASGNSSTSTTTVVVPKSQGRGR